MFKPVASSHHISPACWTVVNSGSAGPTDKMSLLTLEHLRLSCEPLITNRTLGYSAGDVGSVGSAHQAQDVQVSLPSDGLQVSAVSVHSVKIHPRSVDKAACHLYLVVLEAVHHWSVSIRVLDVPEAVHSPVSTVYLQTSLSVLLDSNLGVPPSPPAPRRHPLASTSRMASLVFLGLMKDRGSTPASESCRPRYSLGTKAGSH